MLLITVMIITMIIMNMQSKLCTIFLTTRRPIRHLSVQTPGPERIQKLAEKREKEQRAFPPPWPTPIHNLGMTCMVWNISIGQLGCLSVCAPSQLLHTCSLAECWETGKSPGFIATTENISVTNILLLISILLILNPKHCSYWEEN